MAYEPPYWRINERPRFTALTLGAYMAADDGPRETMRRDMRFERVARTIRYDNVRRAIGRFLASPTRSLAILAECEQMLEHEIREARSRERRASLAHELRALQDFQAGLNSLNLGGFQLWKHGHVFRPMDIEGVTVSVQPDVMVRQVRPRGRDQIGAIIVDVSKGQSCTTDEARRKVEKAMTHSAVLLHTLVADGATTESELASSNHCIVFHAHRAQVVTAPENYKTMMKNMQAVCRDIRRAWAGIEPPAGFDPSRATTRR